MYVITTHVGKMYVVECSEPVTVTNVSTGAVVAQGDGSAQVFFVACAAQYEVSSDSAIVTEVFKLAPRRKLALLQGVAGGWLPVGFTELEWLESSGTQNICVQAPVLRKTGETWYQEVDVQFLSDFRSLVGFKGRTGLYWGRWENKCVGVNADTQYDVPMLEREKLTFTTRCADENFGAAGYWICSLSNGDWLLTRNNEPSFAPSSYLFGLFRWGEEHTENDCGAIRIWSCRCWCDSVSYDLRPVLDADGVPCMYDRVSKTCFYNDGSGSFGYRVKATGSEFAPMSLRDPYYTAPSGIYARKVGENELEIIADTVEPQGEGWLHFANTAEAYEHFGITQEEIL